MGSRFLLSGLLKCGVCGKPYRAQGAKSGQFAYYICGTLFTEGAGTCSARYLNAPRLEAFVVEKIRSNILTEGNIRDMVKVVAEEMDGVTREQRKRLETIEDELEDVKRKLGRIWHFIETSDAVMADASGRIREHRERQERLEYFAEQARAVLAQRRKVLDDANTIAAYAKDMKDFLKESELTERRAFIQSFIKEIVVVPGDALLRYTVPMPDDSLIPGRAAEKVTLPVPVLSTLPDGGPDLTKSRTDADSDITPSLGMGTVYVSVASSPTTSMPSTKLRMSAFLSGIVPSFRKFRKSATYSTISSVSGRTTLRCSSRVSASSLAASNCSSRCLRDMMRGDRTSRVNSLVSMAS